MKEVGVDIKVHLGDIVGYGPQPAQTLELVLEEFNYIVIGNHDYACVDTEYAWGFNPMARQAINWTVGKLPESHIDVLRNLQEEHIVNDLLFIHGSPSEKFDYITDTSDARLAFARKDFRVAFIGHTHVPFIWKERGYERVTFENTLELNNYGIIGAHKTKLGEDERAIINISSVGQPRDGDSRATYGIFDTETNELTIYKIPYPVDRVIGLLQRENVNDRLWKRLMDGR